MVGWGLGRVHVVQEEGRMARHLQYSLIGWR